MLKHKILLVRVLFIAVGLGMLATVYVFQQISMASWVGISGVGNQYLGFAVNKALRLILNDFSCLLIIHAVFQNAKYNKVAFMVFLIELLLVLPIYLFLKLSLEGTSEISSPILSQIHRLIVNPMLMVILMVSFYYQKKMASHRGY